MTFRFPGALHPVLNPLTGFSQRVANMVGLFVLAIHGARAVSPSRQLLTTVYETGHTGSFHASVIISLRYRPPASQ